ncbi:class F sortase [Streptomyces sp. NPDC002787]
MARRRRRPRPWYRTRAYRLTRTVVMTVALVVGGVHLAEDDERTDSAEAGSAWADAGSRGAGAPRDPAAQYFSPPSPEAPSRTAAPTTTPAEPATPAERTERTEPSERMEPRRWTDPSEWPGRTGWASPTPARPTRSTPFGPTALDPTDLTAPNPTGPTAPDVTGPTRPVPAEPTRPTPTSPARSTPADPVRPAPTRPIEPKRPAGPRTLPSSPAKTVTVPYLGIKAPVMELHLDSRRRLPAPPDDKPKTVGWYAEGPAPGGPGTAVVVGHRDTRTGPAVFAALGMIKPGRTVEVRRADGRIAVYTVDAVKTYEKDRFPDKEVYGHRNRPELRLITCGGVYDRRKGYASNVVVFAHLTATREPARKP